MPDPATLKPAYFQAVYASSPDPWHFETSAYEREKYARTMEALPAGRFAAGFEIGCAIGVLTALLADRCDRLLAVDVSDVALAAAQKRLAHCGHVAFANMAVPEQFPVERFDLVMLSEVGYYWSVPDLARAAWLVIEALLPGGYLMLVHWTPYVHDYPLTGDDVHAYFLDLAGPGKSLKHVHGLRTATYRLDLFERHASH